MGCGSVYAPVSELCTDDPRRGRYAIDTANARARTPAISPDECAAEMYDVPSLRSCLPAAATWASRDGLDLDAVMDHCWEAGIGSVLCEGGGTLASSLIEAGIARRLYRFVAPIEIGEGGVPAFPDLAAADSPHDWDAIDEPTRFDEDVLTILDRGD